MAGGGGLAAPSLAADLATTLTWCMVTWDGLWVPCEGPKATSHLGRCISGWQVAGNGVWWQSVSPDEDTSGDTGTATFRVWGKVCSEREELVCVTWGCT